MRYDHPSLRIPTHFAARARALDALELESMAPGGADGIGTLSFEARERLRREWEALDEALFRDLRARLRLSPDPGAAFRGMLDAHLPGWAEGGPEGAAGDPENPGYGILDAFLNGLFHPDPVPEPIGRLLPGMVPFQKTPARILVRLIARLGVRGAASPSHRFCDVGSGLGQACLLVHLLTGIPTWGVEVEPAFVDFARACAGGLGLSRVGFDRLDARAADYSEADLFFLYTPFQGQMLAEVLGRMRRQCRPGTRIFTYGPCTAAVAGEPWLRPIEPLSGEGMGLAGFVRA